MAVLRIDAADTSREVAFDSAWVTPRSGVIATLMHMAHAELPDDVRSCEVTVAVLFRASLILNFLTGGQPQMTFSARAWRSRRSARTLSARVGWSVVTILVNSSCAALRGERDHCAVAWVNYVRRPGRPANIGSLHIGSTRMSST